MGTYNSSISLKPFSKWVNTTMNVVLVPLLLNLKRYLDTQSALRNFQRRKAFPKNVSDYRAYKYSECV